MEKAEKRQATVEAEEAAEDTDNEAAAENKDHSSTDEQLAVEMNGKPKPVLKQAWLANDMEFWIKEAPWIGRKTEHVSWEKHEHSDFSVNEERAAPGQQLLAPPESIEALERRFQLQALPSSAAPARRARAKTPARPNLTGDANFSRDFAEPAPQERRRLHHIAAATKVVAWPSIVLRAGGLGRGGGVYNLDAPGGVALDTSGRVYVSDIRNHRVVRYAPSNTSAPVVVAGGNGRGRGLHQLRYPRGIFVTSAGVLYVADTGNHRVVKWLAGAVEGSVVVGQAEPVYDKLGTLMDLKPCCRAGRAARELTAPHGVFVNGNGDVYVADTGNDRVQMWSVASGVVTTVAGNLSSSATTAQRLKRPEGVFMYSGKVYVADTGNNRVMSWTLGASSGVVVAGASGRGDGVGQLRGPTQVVVETSLLEQGILVPRLYVCERQNNRVMRYKLAASIDPAEKVVAGGCLQSPPYIMPCINGGLHYPNDPSPDRVDQLNPSNMNPPVYHFYGPSALAVRPSAFGQGRVDITVADTLNHRVLTWLG